MFKLIGKLMGKGIWLIICSMFIGLIFVPSIVRAKKVTLKYWLCTGPTLEETKHWKELAKQYMAEHPDVIVKTEHITGNIEPKVLTAFAGGTAPDVLDFQDEPFIGFAKRGVFMDIGPLMEKFPIVNPEDLFPHAMEMFLYNGKQYAMPIAGGPITVFYNKTLFEKAGLNYPTYSWTINDCLEGWKKLTQDIDNDGRIDQFGTSMTTGWVYFMPWLFMHGTRFLSPIPYVQGVTRSAINCPEGIEALQWWQDLRWKHNLTPTPAQEGLLGAEWFKTGRVASTVTGPWMFGEYRAVKGLNWDIAHMPTGPKGYKATRWSYDGLMISEQSKHKEEAWKFIGFIMSPRGQRFITKEGTSLPSLMSVASEPAFVRPDTPQHEEIMLEVLKKYARLQPYNPYWAEVGRAIQKQVDLLLLNKISAKECAKRMEEAVNEVLGVK